MGRYESTSGEASHSHVFLGTGHQRNERKTWAVIALCGLMMVAEIAGGWLFGSIALIADGLHMSTHAGALLLAALAYSYARRHAHDPRFCFGTGKLGDLAGFTSAVVLAMIAILIGYEAVNRVLAPVPIDFNEAIAIAVLGLLVNIASVWLLSGTDHHHAHSHGHGHSHDHDHGDHHAYESEHRFPTENGVLSLSVFEDGVPPRFRLRHLQGDELPAQGATVRTLRPDGSRQTFTLVDRGGFLESVEEIPEPHAFTAYLDLGEEITDSPYGVRFEERDHAHTRHHAAHRDNNMRAAVIHVMADATVSVLVILGLVLARFLGWVWMDPLVGIIGAVVIASWSYALIRDTGSVLLDMTPDERMAEEMRAAVESDGDRLTDLHLWRLGPGHMGAILSVVTSKPLSPHFYRERLLLRFHSLSHVTVEVHPRGL
jgi:cation diffusion facilitator family transporter